MKINIKQVSSLEKIRANDELNHGEIYKKSVLAGERFSYQISMQSPEYLYFVDVSLESSLKDNIKLYLVKDAHMDAPVTEKVEMEDYITHEPGLMPDILIPLEETNNRLSVGDRNCTIWVKIDIPKDAVPDIYPIEVKLSVGVPNEEITEVICKTMSVEVIPVAMPEQKLIYTRWFYADCIAVTHNVEIFSEKHWKLIDQYIAAAADVGINMILVPIHTPPLDTEIGTKRPCVQLVDIEKKGKRYEFSFDKFKRFIDICKKNGIKYFEMAHMFSQWGAKCAPNIQVTENGKIIDMFGWHVATDAPEYIDFLVQYISAISEELRKEGICENTYFHISDEPYEEHIEAYRSAYELVKPLLGSCKLMDALSKYDFYENGLVETPVCATNHIEPFIENKVDSL